MIIKEFENAKTFLLKVILQEVFVISKIKNGTVPWTYFINDLNGEEIIGRFYEKELKKKKKRI